MKEYFNGIDDDVLAEIHKNLRTIYDDGDKKTFGLSYRTDLGYFQMTRIAINDVEETNHVQIKSYDGDHDYEFCYSDDMLRGLMLLFGFYLDGKTIEKAVTVKLNEENRTAEMKPLGVVYEGEKNGKI